MEQDKQGTDYTHGGVKTPCWNGKNLQSPFLWGTLPFAGEGEYIKICVSKVIQPFPQKFWCLQEPKKTGNWYWLPHSRCWGLMENVPYLLVCDLVQ